MPTKIAPKTTTKTAKTEKQALAEKANAIAERNQLLLKLQPKIDKYTTTITESRVTFESNRLQLAFTLRDLRVEHKLSGDEVKKLLHMSYADAGQFDAKDLTMEKHPSEYADCSTLKQIVCHKVADKEWDAMVKRVKAGEAFSFKAIKAFAQDKDAKAKSLSIKSKGGRPTGSKAKSKDSKKPSKLSIEDFGDYLKKGLIAAAESDLENDELSDKWEEVFADFAASGETDEDEDEDEDEDGE